MPYKPKHPCGYPNCPTLTDEAYCEKHKPKVNRDYNRYIRDEDSKSFYNSAAWRRLARLQLRREPLCAECFKAGRIQPAEIADHIQPIREGGARLDRENLQSLCRSCHSRKHGERRGD
jgi:5-methylcytosine-specific restriction protein A